MGGYGKGSGKGKGMSSQAGKGKFDVNPHGAMKVLRRDDICAKPHLDVPVRVQYMSSYNFLDSDGRTPAVSRLLVPGLPRPFRGCCSVGRLPPDTEDMVADENHLQIPQYPTFPIFAAVRQLHPDFDFADVHVVCESNDLRKLLGFIHGDCSPTSMLTGKNNQRDSSFRLDVDVVKGSCLVLTRHELSDVVSKDLLPKNTVAKSFQEALTARAPLGDISPQISTYRIINKVELEDMILLVRSEIDACDYGGMDLSEVEYDEGWISTECPSVQVRRAGAVVKQGTMVELKTKSKKSMSSGISWAAYYFQMLLAGTGKLALGVHDAGTFGVPSERSLEEVRAQCEPGRIDEDLSMLVDLLRQLRGIATEKPGCHQLALFCDGIGGPLVIKTRDDDPRVLPM